MLSKRTQATRSPGVRKSCLSQTRSCRYKHRPPKRFPGNGQGRAGAQVRSAGGDPLPVLSPLFFGRARLQLHSCETSEVVQVARQRIQRLSFPRAIALGAALGRAQVQRELERVAEVHPRQ